MSRANGTNGRQSGRRAALPGADELFRATGEEPAPSPGLTVVDGARRGSAQSQDQRLSSGRQRHEQKITVYVSEQELLNLERARLTLRADHGVGVDRGRIVREALAYVLADLNEKGEASLLVRQLREG